MNNSERKIKKWFIENWDDIININVFDAEENRLGRLFNILMIISIGVVIFLTTIMMLMPSLKLAKPSFSSLFR